jgi:hypothetical protein
LRAQLLPQLDPSTPAAGRATGDPDLVQRLFLRECADPACHAEVRATAGQVSAGPVLACGHR